MGLPTSTTHVITSAILGVGLSKRMSAINWTLAYRIVCAWVITIPASATMGFLSYTILSPLLSR
jgi:PiT family inorganic phosphate transporter